MTGVHASDAVRSPTGRRSSDSAIRLSVVSGVAFFVSIGVIAVAYVLGDANAVEDNWAGFALGFVAFAGLLGALLGFVLGVVSGLRGEGWRDVWLPLALIPAIVTVLVIGELFVWE
jgi:hypothetical protein